MRVRWLGQPRAVHGILRHPGAEYEDLGEEFVKNGMCESAEAPKAPPFGIKGRSAAASAEEE